MSDTLHDLDDVYKMLSKIVDKLDNISGKLDSLMRGKTGLKDLQNVLEEISRNTARHA